MGQAISIQDKGTTSCPVFQTIASTPRRNGLSQQVLRLYRLLMPVILLLLLLFSAPGASAEPSQLPLISSTTVASELSGIGRIRGWRAGKGGCTGVLVTPRLALTAAHCVLGKPKRSFVFDPSRLPNSKRVGISEVVIHPDFKGEKDVARLYADIAVLVLGADVPEDYAEPIPLGTAPGPGKPHAIYGYLGPENPPLLGHPECQIFRISPGVLGSDCVVGSGMSGSPLLAGQTSERTVVGIIVAIIQDETSPVRTLIAEADASLLPVNIESEDLLPEPPAPGLTE